MEYSVQNIKNPIGTTFKICQVFIHFSPFSTHHHHSRSSFLLGSWQQPSSWSSCFYNCSHYILFSTQEKAYVTPSLQNSNNFPSKNKSYHLFMPYRARHDRASVYPPYYVLTRFLLNLFPTCGRLDAVLQTYWTQLLSLQFLSFFPRALFPWSLHEYIPEFIQVFIYPKVN